MAVDETLFWLYDGAGVIDDRTLREGPSRSRLSTIEQDPTFAFRILGDIAITALSAATNDSTMAALAMIARPKRGTRFPEDMAVARISDPHVGRTVGLGSR